MKQIYYDFSSSLEVEPCVAIKNIKEDSDSTVIKQTTDCLEFTFFYDNHPPVNVAVNRAVAQEIFEKLKTICRFN